MSEEPARKKPDHGTQSTTRKPTMSLDEYEKQQASWEAYQQAMFPAASLEGENLELLQEILQKTEKTSVSSMKQLAHKVGGLAWVNALHSLDPKANDTQETPARQTPLTYILQNHHSSSQVWRMASILLGIGADPNIRNEAGDTPLSLVAHSIREGPHLWRVLNLLVDAGANPNAIVRDQTILQWTEEQCCLAATDTHDSNNLSRLLKYFEEQVRPCQPKASKSACFSCGIL